jgi:hypothetical protein
MGFLLRAHSIDCSKSTWPFLPTSAFLPVISAALLSRTLLATINRHLHQSQTDPSNCLTLQNSMNLHLKGKDCPLLLLLILQLLLVVILAFLSSWGHCSQQNQGLQNLF